MTRGHAAAVLCAFALGLIAVCAVPPLQRDRVIDPAAWVAAAHEVEALAPGSVVLVHPPWRDDVAAALRAAAALDPQLLGGAIITTAYAPQQGAAWPPLVVLRERGGVPLPRALRRAVVSTTQTREGVVIERLLATTQFAPSGASGVGDANVGTDLLADLTAFETELRTPAGTIACPLNASAQLHVCTDQPQWMHQGEEALSIDGQPVTCMWAHPPKTGALVFRLAHRPLAGSVRLDLALSDTAAQTPNGAAVTARLQVGDARGEVTRQGVRGFASTRVSVPPDAANADVTVEISTPNDAQRHACIRLFEEPARAAPAVRNGGTR